MPVRVEYKIDGGERPRSLGAFDFNGDPSPMEAIAEAARRLDSERTVPQRCEVESYVEFQVLKLPLSHRPS